MPFLPSAMTAIGAVKTAYDTGQLLVGAVQKVKNREVKQHASQLLDDLMNLRGKVEVMAQESLNLSVANARKTRPSPNYYGG